MGDDRKSLNWPRAVEHRRRRRQSSLMVGRLIVLWLTLNTVFFGEPVGALDTEH